MRIFASSSKEHVRGSIAGRKVARLAMWAEFIDAYERFTDLLSAAAKDGCTEPLEREYQLVRRWFLERYFNVSGRLSRYLTRPATPLTASHQTSEKKRLAPQRGLDALEALMIRNTLREILDEDSGDLIAMVTQLSDAVYRCNSDCRRLWA